MTICSKILLFTLCLLIFEVRVHSAEDLLEIISTAAKAEREERFSDARTLYERATMEFGNSSMSWAALGEHLRFYTSESGAAKKAFESAIRARDQEPQAAAFAWRGLGELAAKAGKPAEAAALMLKSLQAKPLADTHRSLCHLYVMQRDWKNAADHARRAAALDPDDPIALLLYAAQLERSGDHKAGVEQASKAMSLAGLNSQGKHAAPVHCCVFYNLAGYYAVSRDSARALAMLESFFKTPNHRHLTEDEIKNDPDFIELRKSEEFKQLISKYFANKATAR